MYLRKSFNRYEIPHERLWGYEESRVLSPPHGGPPNRCQNHNWYEVFLPAEIGEAQQWRMAAARQRLAALQHRYQRLRIVQPERAAAWFAFEIEGLSAQETAEITGASLPAVKSRLHRARLYINRGLAANE